MWFGSEKGLARYDGHEIRIYRQHLGDPRSLAHDLVRSLLVDHQGILWVGTDRGLCFYREKLDKFACHNTENIRPWPRDAVRAMALDSEGNLFFATDLGLYQVLPDRAEWIELPLPLPTDDPSATPGITALVTDNQDRLWVGTRDFGLIAFHRQTEEATYFTANADVDNTLVYNRVSALELDAQNRLWIGTYGGGLSILSADRTRFENHTYGDNPHGLSSNILWDIFKDSQGRIWLAVDQGGVVFYDENRGFVATRHKPYDSTSIGSDQVRTIYEDKNGDLWMGTFPSGVSFHNRAAGRVRTFKHEPGIATSLSHSAVLAVHEDTQGRIWVGTEDGLNLFSPNTGHFTHYRHSQNIGLTAKAVLSIAQYDEDTLWIGTWSGGLLAFDIRTGRFTPTDTSPPGTDKNSQFIWDILRDRAGDFWIATEFEGVAHYRREQRQFRFYSRDPKDIDSLPGNFSWAVLEDRRGAIWMATSAGLAVLHPGEEKPRRIQKGSAKTGGLDAERIIALYEDRAGQIWIGTQENGVFVYSPETEQFRHIDEAQGLPTGMSSGFIEDVEGQMWILTTNGLIKVNASHLQIFNAENGLAGSNFNRNAGLLSSDGLLYIGGFEGLNIFKAKDLDEELPEFPVLITAMRILNKEVVIGAPGSPLREALTFTDMVELTHRDIMFAFDFSALNYRYSQDMRFAYVLEGFDENWIEIGSNRSATYTNIPPGDYRFRVLAFHGQNEPVESKTLRIVIKPAPWRSWWAYVIYLVIASIAISLLVQHLRLRGRTKIYQRLSATDVLTGIANRLGLTEAAGILFNHPQRGSICVIFIDIDYFKTINDTRGHDSGDRVLMEVADVLRRSVRQSDLLGRWGGEEFVLVCAGIGKSDGLRLAEKIRQQIEERAFEQDRLPLKVTISTGFAFVKPEENFEEAIKRADQALYLAKAAGRNCVISAD